eukprot:4288011-Pleurochrysis_carterae.AAC.3
MAGVALSRSRRKALLVDSPSPMVVLPVSACLTFQAMCLCLLRLSACLPPCQALTVPDDALSKSRAYARRAQALCLALIGLSDTGSLLDAFIIRSLTSLGAGKCAPGCRAFGALSWCAGPLRPRASYGALPSSCELSASNTACENASRVHVRAALRPCAGGLRRPRALLNVTATHAASSNAPALNAVTANAADAANADNAAALVATPLPRLLLRTATVVFAAAASGQSLVNRAVSALV